MDLEFWYLPLVQTEKKGMFPMEVCVLMANQRYSMKLNPEQVRISLQVLKWTRSNLI